MKSLNESQTSNKSDDSDESHMMQRESDDHHQETDADQSYTLYDYDDYETNSYSTIGIKKLDLAPDVDSYKPYTAPSQNEQFMMQRQQQQLHLQQINKQWDKQQQQHSGEQHQPHDLDPYAKKKYAKEAWPGRKPGPTSGGGVGGASHHANSPPIDVTINPLSASSKTISPALSISPLSATGTNATATSPNKKNPIVAPKRLII